jgi:hypothetical protein
LTAFLTSTHFFFFLPLCIPCSSISSHGNILLTASSLYRGRGIEDIY